MKIPFRQGLIAYQRDGLGQPQYLLPSTTNGFVALNVSPTPTSVSIAHGSADYLLVFSSTVPAAWGPIPGGVTSYLYWDVDLLTGQTSFGFTTLEPILSAAEPSAPQVDQHWFDLSEMKMKVWLRGRWYEKVRAFAGKVPNGSILSMTPADSEPFYAPWQNATTLQVEGNPGYISTDVFGNPIRTLAGEFVTSRTPVRFNSTTGTTGVLAVLPNAFIPVRASQNIPRMSLVYFSGEDEVGLASGNPATNPPRIPIGIVQEELFTSEVGVVTQSGEITYDQWDWSADIGKPLYCGDNGEVVTVRPNGLLVYRVGFVKNAKTIVFQIDAETQPQIYQATNNDVIVNGASPISTSFVTSPLNERIWTVEIQAATDTQDGYMSAAQALQLSDHDTRLTQAELDIAGKADIVHSHVISDVADLQLTLDGKANIVHFHPEYALTTHNHDLVYAPIVHSHTIPDVAGLQTELNAKADIGHTHPITDVTDLALILSQKSDIGHTHLISEVAGLQLALDSKADVAHNHDLVYAPIIHAHVISDVTGLQLALDGKADVGHVHAINDLTDVDTATTAPALDNVLKWNGTNWVPGVVTGGGSITVPGDDRDVLMSDGAGGLKVQDLSTQDYFDIFNGSRLIIGQASAEGAVIEPRGYLDGETPSGSLMGSVLVQSQANYNPFGLPIPGGPFSNKRGGNVLVFAGSTGYDTAPGGSVVVRAGEAVGNTSMGGSVIIAAGPSSLLDNGGHAAVFIGSQDNQEGGGGWMVVNSFGAVGFTGGSGIFIQDGDSSALADKSQNDTDWGQPGMIMRGAGQSYRPSWIAPEIKPMPLQTINTSVTTLDIGSALHHNSHYRVNAASNVTYTVRADSFWVGSEQYWEGGFSPTNPGPMPTGGVILFGKHGAGNITLVADVGVTINTPETLVLSKMHGKISLIKVGPNTWDVEGNLEPA